MKAARGLAWLAHAFDRCARVTTYATAGVQSLAELRAGIAREWSTFNTEPESRISGLIAAEQGFVDAYIRPGDRVLLIGSGSGRDLLPLVSLGCDVTGVEPSIDAIAACRRALTEAGLRAKLVCGIIEDVALDGIFDAAIFSFFAYSYMPTTAGRIAALTRVAAHVRPGGPVCISHTPHRRPHRWLIRVGRLAGALARADWRIEDGDVLRRVGIRGACAFEHVFTQAEIDREVEAAGLEATFVALGNYPYTVAIARSSTAFSRLRHKYQHATVR